jgi:hypothetical protein
VAAPLRTVRGVFIEKQRKEHSNKTTNMSEGSRIHKGSSGQSRITPEERSAMEVWLLLKREYAGGKGKDMTNLRWINGAAAKGLSNVSGDPKQAKQIGAYEALAAYMNEKRVKGARTWNAEYALTKWKNMKTSFKRAIKKYPMPDTCEWEQSGKSKEDLSSEVERVTALREAACQSYKVLWDELRDHPIIHPAAPFESVIEEDEDDASSGSDNDEGEGRGDASDIDTGTATARSPKSPKSPKAPSSKGSSAQGKASSKKKVKVSKAPVKLSLKKSSEQTRHRDITAAYISMKSEWNRMWLRTMVMKQRQDVYFMCVDRGWDRASTLQVMTDLGLGKLPAFMDSWYGNDDGSMPERAEEMRSSAYIEDIDNEGENNADESEPDE